MAVQALDLMSLHFEMHDFYRPRLALAVLALVHLREFGLLVFYPCDSLLQLEAHVIKWAEIVSDRPDDAFSAFKIYLSLYCKEMLPENFNFNYWPRLLLKEMLFTCQFFTFKTQFSEPPCR